jgi:O-antigen ligase
MAAMYFARDTLQLAAVAGGMLAGLRLFQRLERFAVIIVLVILISPPMAHDVSDPIHQGFLGNVFPTWSVTICEAVLLANLLFTAIEPSRSGKRRPLDLLVLAFGFVMVLGAVYGMAVKGNVLSRVLTEIRPSAGLFLGFFNARLCLHGAQSHRAFWDSAGVAVLLKCLQGFWLYYLGVGVRYQGSLRVFSDAELLFMVAVFAMGLVAQLDRTRTAGLAVLALVALFLVLSSSRFIWVVTSLTSVMILLFHRRRVKAFLTLGFLIPLSAVAAVAVAGSSAAWVSRLTSIADWHDDASNVARIKESQNAWQTIREEPLLGAGLGGEWVNKEDFRLGEGEFRASVFKEMTLVHNAYLWTWLKLGMAGIVLLLAMAAHSLAGAAGAVRRSSARNRKYAWGILAGLVAFYIILLVGNWLLHFRCMIAWGILLASAIPRTADRQHIRGYLAYKPFRVGHHADVQPGPLLTS